MSVLHRPRRLPTGNRLAARMSVARPSNRFVLQAGVLLAVFGERWPTRDIDLQAQSIANDPATVRAAITGIAAMSLDDGVVCNALAATAEVIREEDQYQAVRVSMTARLASQAPPAARRSASWLAKWSRSGSITSGGTGTARLRLPFGLTNVQPPCRCGQDRSMPLSADRARRCR
jgi:hypothetical protein